MLIPRLLLGLMLTLCCLIEQKGQAENTQEEITQPIVHQRNQQLCAQIMQKFYQSLPTSSTPQQRAHALSHQLDAIARELLKQGLDLNAYHYKTCSPSPCLQFAMIPLWEGADHTQPEIPLTLFIYVWPPEHLAKQVAQRNGMKDNDPRTSYYATNIHGHPLSCALTVLRGTLEQENYQSVKGWSFPVAQKQDEEILRSGTTSFDDGSVPFIHRLLCRDKGSEPAFSLHGYGASTAQQVRYIFQTNYEQYCYPYVLQDGKLIKQAW